MMRPGQLDREPEPVILRTSRETVMQQVTIHAAKIHLSRLIEAVLNGEEVVIAKGGRPVIRLVPAAAAFPGRTARGPVRHRPGLPRADGRDRARPLGGQDQVTAVLPGTPAWS